MVTEIWSWESVIATTERFVSKLGVPQLGLREVPTEVDVLPDDPSEVAGKELANKLFEYSGYVSYLDAEIGRIDAQCTAIRGEMNDVIDAKVAVEKHTKPRAKAELLMQDPSMMKAERRLIELEAIKTRVQGLRDGFATRMQAISREITRRGHLV